MAIRVVLAEDNLLVREGVRRLLETRKDATIEVVASCGDLDSLLEAVETTQPDVVVTDIRMPPTQTDEGLQIAARLRKSHPQIGVVLLSQFDAPVYAHALLDEGSADARTVAVFLLRAEAGLSAPEVSRLLGISIRSVRSQTTSVRRQIRRVELVQDVRRILNAAKPRSIDGGSPRHRAAGGLLWGLRAARLAAGLSGLELATRVGCHVRRSAVSSICTVRQPGQRFDHWRRRSACPRTC